MEYTVIRLEESANVHGGAEVFVQVQFTDAATGCDIPCAMWLSDSQTNQYLADHDTLPAIIATWADDAARPLYKTSAGKHWLQFDGVDDSLSTGDISWVGVNKFSLFDGVVSASTAAAQNVFGIGTGVGGEGEIEHWLSWTSAGTPTLYAVMGGAAYGSITPANSLPAATKGVFSYELDGTKTTNAEIYKTTRLNTVSRSLSFIGSDTGFANNTIAAIHIGKRGNNTQFLGGNLYSLIVRGALSTAQDIAATETWVNGKTGAY